MSNTRHERVPLVTKRQLFQQREHQLTERQEQRFEIQMLHKNGVCEEDIVFQGHSSYMARKWTNRFTENDNCLIYTANKSPGRPRKITKEMEEDLVLWSKDNGLKRMTTMLTEKYQDIMVSPEEKLRSEKWSVSKETIRKHLVAIGAKARATGRQPAITAAQVLKRIEFAKEFKDFDWKNAVFVDETYAQDHGKTNPRNDRQWTFSKEEVVHRGQVAHPAQIGYFGATCIHGVLPLIELYRDNKPTFEEGENKTKQRQENKETRRERTAEKEENRRKGSKQTS